MAKHRRSKKKKVAPPKTRKELRKEKRLEKKDKKRQFFSQSKKPGKFVKLDKEAEEKDNFDDEPTKDPTIIDDGEEIESDFELSDEEVKAQLSKVSSKPEKTANPPKLDRFQEVQQREKKKQNELQKKMRKRRIEQLKAANEEDDKVIRRLEKKLKIEKHKNENSVHKMFNDGLDYALELCLPKSIEKMYAAAKEAAEIEDSGDEFEEDLAAALGEKSKENTKSNSAVNELNDKGKSKNVESTKSDKLKIAKLKQAESKYFKDVLDSDLSGPDSEIENSDSEPEEVHKRPQNGRSSARSDEEDKSESDGGSEELDDEDHDSEGSDDSAGNSEEDLEEILGSRDEDSAGEDDLNENSLENSEDLSGVDEGSIKKQTWEDIYGRQRDNEGNVLKETSQKYIPPHVRARLEAETPTDAKRKEKLERLRKQCKGYLNRLSEANMHKIASEIESVYMSNPRFDVNSTLSKLILEALVMNVLSKERLVLEHAMLVAVLHGNVGSEIGANFLQILITRFNELMRNVEALEVESKELDNVVFLISHFYTFKIMQHSLIFEIINTLVGKLCEKTVECILLVLRSVGFQLRKDDPGALKDLILSIQKKASESPLEIKENPRLKFMLDILNAIKNNNMTKIPNYDPSLAEHLKKILKAMLTNGKYIATLNITMDDLLRADEKGKWWVVGSAWTGNIKDIGSANQTEKSKNDTEKFSEQLLGLARQQRMNTEDRKNVFCIIMSAEDYVDAFERLLHLAIKDHRVIASIIIHCCLSEKTYNPYYAVLAQKFCEYDRKYQLAVQFATWDRIKDIHSANKSQIVNLAKFLLHLIISGGLPISVLKVVEFAELDKITLRLVRQIMLGLLLGKEEDCKEVFGRIAPSAKLNTFKDSIRLFMHHFLLKNSGKETVPKEQIDLLKTRVKLADSVLSYIDSRVKF